MRSARDFATDYIDLWNDVDPARRADLFARTWTETASYRDPLMQGRGFAEIDGLIAAVQQRFPGFRFSLAGQPDGHGDVVRFSWALGPQGGEAIVEGTDIVQREGDRISSVIGFLDKVPQAV